MTPLDQFKSMPKEPQLGDREKIIQDNADYSTLNVPLADQKAQLMTELYGVKQQNEDSPDNNRINLEKIESDSQYFPNLKALYEAGHIDKDTFIKTAESLEDLNDQEGLNVLMKVVNGLSDSKVRENIVKTFDKKEKTTEENFEKTEFFKDSLNLNINLDKGIGGLEIMLADNYVSINNTDGTDNKTRDLSISMDTTMNTILKNSSPDFKKQNGPLISEIKIEKSLNKKYSLLKDLYKEDLKRDAILGGKKSNEEIKRKKGSLLEKAKEISEKIKEAQNIKDERQKKQEIDKLNLKKEEIIEEGKNIDGFEAEVKLLLGGEKDKEPEKIEKREEN